MNHQERRELSRENYEPAGLSFWGIIGDPRARHHSVSAADRGLSINQLARGWFGE